MTDLEITSPANARLKGLIALRRRRIRELTGTTLLEGYDELGLAVAAGVTPRALYYCPDLMADPQSQLDLVTEVRDRGCETVRVARPAFERTAYREGPDGFLAEVHQPGVDVGDLSVPEGSLVLLAEGIEKPGNLGAMLRTADAAGVAAVVAIDPLTDWGNPNVVRASKGTVFTVPVANGTLDETLEWLRAQHLRLLATTPDTDQLYTDADLSGGVAVAVGTEKQGLTNAALAAADARIRIPMSGTADSLNVATAAAIVLFEAVRQRNSRA